MSGAVPRVIHSYRVEHDVGLAPNPFHGVCTLAVCKPGIRGRARAGDLVIGMSSADKKRTTNPRAPVYVMQIAERLHFDDYWADPRFEDRKPVPDAGSMWQAGDNIYHQHGGKWVQATSWHSRPDGGVSDAKLRADTGRSQHVLIGHGYAYWGSGGPELPGHLIGLMKNGIGESTITDPAEVASIWNWAEPLLGLGRVGWPYAWSMRGRPLHRVLARPGV